ncbi:MAG: MBL fold metallo-hydrolase [Acidobacteria bacterium]|nr:MBL fold metallo-hydrolase [Acidobacteriota bacterium]
MRFVLFLFCAVAFAQDTRVILLGTGTPNPDPQRMGPAVAVVSGERAYLVDCGPGVVRRAAQAGLKMEQLTRAFITHLHSDHTAGYPDLIFTPAVTGRREPFEVYGPPGLRNMTAHIMKAWKQDIDTRLRGLEPSVPQAYAVRAHEGKPGEVYKDTTLRVVAFPVNHGAWKHARGYRFEVKDKVVVISGDTTYSENLIAAAKGCDILVHEVYSQKGWEKRPPEWQRYHAAFHTSAPDLGRIAAKVRPGKLVLYHELPMGEPPDQILKEIRQHYGGAVVYGNDLDVIR